MLGVYVINGVTKSSASHLVVHFLKQAQGVVSVEGSQGKLYLEGRYQRVSIIQNWGTRGLVECFPWNLLK